MLTSEVIALAKASELKQLAVGKDETAIISFINLGMLQLYKRFSLKEEEAIVTLRNGKTKYILDGTDVDVDMQSDNDFLIVTECYDMEGETVTVNDESDILGVMTPSYNVLEVPNIIDGERLSLIYRVAPKFVVLPTEKLQLPMQLLEALLNYIGYKGHATITPDVKTENNSHYMRFEKSCQDVEDQGLILVDDLLSYKFESRGFV